MNIVTTRPAPLAALAPDRPAASAGRRSLAAWQVALAAFGIFALALILRLVGLEQHLTADDQDWVRRAVRFGQAVEQGNLRGTFQSGHPGVPVLWLAELGIGQQRIAELAPLLGSLPALEKSPAYVPAINAARRALALASAATTALLALLTWRLFGPGPGLLAGLLLAAEPFLVAHGRLFHSDPLLAQLMAASLLAGLVAIRESGRVGESRLSHSPTLPLSVVAWTLLSGALAGLAFSTKVPAVFLFGFVPLVGLVWARARAGWLDAARSRRLVVQLAVWGLAAGGVYFLLWPALWGDPFGTLWRLVQTARGVGESPRRWGNFFLGRVYDEDVGPLFYLVATPLRLSPITSLGLVGLGVSLARGWLAGRRSAVRPLVVALVAYVVLFDAMMTLSPKKLDRYVLPAFPTLIVLAAVGFWLVLRRLTRPNVRWATVGALGLAQVLLVASVQPYPLSFFNPLLGGIGTARQAMIVGWGEGTDQVAAYLDQQPDASEIVVVSLYNDLIQPKFAGTAVPPWEWQRADYLADYVNMDQRNLVPGPLQRLVREEQPVFVARINGLEYARVYRIPPELKGSSDQGSRGRSVPRP